MIQIVKDISSMPPPFNMVVFVVLIATLGTVLKVIAKQTSAYFSQRQELEFKRELLDRGLTGEEVERVIRARGPQVEAQLGGVNMGHGAQERVT